MSGLNSSLVQVEDKQWCWSGSCGS